MHFVVDDGHAIIVSLSIPYTRLNFLKFGHRGLTEDRIRFTGSRSVITSALTRTKFRYR